MTGRVPALRFFQQPPLLLGSQGLPNVFALREHVHVARDSFPHAVSGQHSALHAYLHVDRSALGPFLLPLLLVPRYGFGCDVAQET